MNINFLYQYLFDDTFQEEVKKQEEEIKASAPISYISEEQLLEQRRMLDEQYEIEGFNAAMQPILELQQEQEKPKHSFKYSENIDNSFLDMPASALDADKYLSAIYGNEGGQTGVDPANVKGTASGKYALTYDARSDVYNKYYKKEMTRENFENKYNKDSYFEYQVAKNLAKDKIYSSKTVKEAFGSWYYPQGAKQGNWNMVPAPGYGNNLTIGQYAEKAFKNYK